MFEGSFSQLTLEMQGLPCPGLTTPFPRNLEVLHEDLAWSCNRMAPGAAEHSAMTSD